VERLEAVVVWDDAGKFRSIYMPGVIKVERGEPESSPDIALNLTIELASVRE
jgi:hypothetical protein